MIRITKPPAAASISKKVEDIFGRTDLIVKVKEPQLSECKMLRSNQTLFTYLHLAADREQTHGAACLGRHRHRLRDGDGAGWLAAAVDSDE